MEKQMKKNELFQASHMVILISYTIFSVILIGEALLLSWEKWALLLIGFSLISSWILHIGQVIPEYQRIWIYSILMMGTFFFYGIHETSAFDLAPVVIAVIMIYTMTGLKALITLWQVTYYVTIGYDILQIYFGDEGFDSLIVTRTLLHLTLVFMSGWISRTIIDKWEKVLVKSREEIEILTDATDRLNDFLANISHEIRTPINAVIGLTGVCIEKEKDEEIKANMQSVAEAGKRVAEQISDILDYSEIDMEKVAVNGEDYMIDSLLNDLVVQLSPYKAPELELIIDVDPELPTAMHADVTKLKKVLWHLIMNGLKYTKEGGVYVRITSIPQAYGLNLCMEVRDTGIGMSEEEMEHIFERFFQGDSGRTRSTSGLGLGMSVVNGFVKALNGFLTIESKLGEGTTIRISIPQTIVDSSKCMAVSEPENLNLGAYLHFEKFENPQVREFYNAMVKDIVQGLKVRMHRVDNIENLRALSQNVHFTHLFVGEEEYESDIEFIENMAKNTLVVVVANNDFKLPKGSRARIMRKPFYCFPVVNVLNSSVDTGREEEGRLYCRGARALVVDDEPMNLLVANNIFRQYGMVVSTAASGREAIEMCNSNEYDIIFMDHMMPEMDGIETMKRIRTDFDRDKKDVPIVALTANAVSTAKEMFIKEGFDGFISKPIELIEMERVLKKVLPKSLLSIERIDSQPEKEEAAPKKAETESIMIMREERTIP
ncbi:MAG: response regulator, partial [Acetatifactor sp.]|nr:response regulator [Acetatifactor sp.]